MMKSIRILALALAAICFLLPGALLADDGIPSRPEELVFEKLSFELPDAAKFRHTLDNGIVVYVGEEHSLPLVDLRVRVRTGSFLDPADKPGVAALTGSLIRKGGTSELSPELFDEKADFLAAQMGASIGDTGGSASFNCTTNTLNECMDLFFEMIRRPGFDQARLDLEKTTILEEMKQRNDDASSIASREWQWLLRGRDHFSSRRLTASQLEKITRDDLVAFHKASFHPGNFQLTVSGDIDTKTILAELNRRFADWDQTGPEVAWPPKASTHIPKPGVYYVDKEIPQGKVFIGHLGLMDGSWSHKDRYAIAVMNDILGGGGFTSRITKKVRSDEGLAYSAGSSYRFGSLAPGVFSIFYQSKSSSVALAAKLSIDEIKRIQQGQVSAEELQVAKASFIDTFPRNFESTSAVVGRFAQDEYEGRSHAYWTNYRQNYEKVTIEDVQRVAQEYLHPDELVFLIVGNWAEIAPGDADARASMKLFHGGKATELPLRDPLTLEPK